MLYGLIDGFNRSSLDRAAQERAETTEAIARLAYRAIVAVDAAVGWLPATVAALGRRVAAGVTRARRRRQTVRQLDALDDRMLRDAGLLRGEIRSIAEALLDGPAIPPANDNRTVADRLAPDPANDNRPKRHAERPCG